MKIILLDKIQKLGEIGDIVEVNSGYARNFLIPQKKAAFASKKNITEVEARKDELAAMSADMLIKAGFIAQEVQEVLKEENAEYTAIVNDKDPDKLQVGASGMIPMMINAIKELSAENTALKARVTALEGG